MGKKQNRKVNISDTWRHNLAEKRFQPLSVSLGDDSRIINTLVHSKKVTNFANTIIYSNLLRIRRIKFFNDLLRRAHKLVAMR